MADETDGSWQPTRRDYQDALGGLGVVGFVAAMSSSAGGWDSPGAPDIARGRCERFNATEPRFGAVCMRGGTELPRSGVPEAGKVNCVRHDALRKVVGTLASYRTAEACNACNACNATNAFQ